MRHHYSQLLSRLSTALGRESARSELRWMMQALPDDAQRDTKLADMVSRRTSGEPLQYILGECGRDQTSRVLLLPTRGTGTQPFGPLTLLTRPPVLIPRPETEDWTIRLSELVKPSPQKPVRLLDLCTGSGCIPLLLCKLWPQGSVRAYGVDIGAEAIQLATENAALTGFDAHTEDTAATANTVARNTFRVVQADMLAPDFARTAGLRAPFDVITANPPYIPRREYDALPRSVRAFEDPRALLGDPGPGHDAGDGLTFYRALAHLLARDAPPLLAPGGVLAVEVGMGQAARVARILQDAGGLARAQIWRDPWDVDRVVVATR